MRPGSVGRGRDAVVSGSNVETRRGGAGMDLGGETMDNSREGVAFNHLIF